MTDEEDLIAVNEILKNLIAANVPSSNKSSSKQTIK